MGPPLLQCAECCPAVCSISFPPTLYMYLTPTLSISFNPYFEYFFNSYLVLVNFLTGSAKQQISYPLQWTSRKVELSFREILFYAKPIPVAPLDSLSRLQFTVWENYKQNQNNINYVIRRIISKVGYKRSGNVFLDEPVIFCKYLFLSCEKFMQRWVRSLVLGWASHILQISFLFMWKIHAKMGAQ